MRTVSLSAAATLNNAGLVRSLELASAPPLPAASDDLSTVFYVTMLKSVLATAVFSQRASWAPFLYLMLLLSRSSPAVHAVGAALVGVTALVIPAVLHEPLDSQLFACHVLVLLASSTVLILEAASGKLLSTLRRACQLWSPWTRGPPVTRARPPRAALVAAAAAAALHPSALALPLLCAGLGCLLTLPSAAAAAISRAAAAAAGTTGGGGMRTTAAPRTCCVRLPLRGYVCLWRRALEAEYGPLRSSAQEGTYFSCNSAVFGRTPLHSLYS